MPPKVSVVITSYNYGRFLPDAVKSALSQTYGDLEIIIVDDGSTDDTLKVAEGLIRSHPELPIKLIAQENKGAAAARNAGIAAASGEYIVSLDGDDWIRPEFLEETVRVLDDYPSVSIAYTALEQIGPDGRSQVITREEYDFQKLIRENLCPSCNLFRKKAWQDAGGYKKLTGAEDWELWITMGELGHFGKLIPKPLYVHRVHGTSKYSITSSKINSVMREIRTLHASTCYPRLSHICPRLLWLALWFKYGFIKPLSHFLYRNFPQAHSFIRSIFYRAS